MPQAAVHAAVERRVPRLALVPQDQRRARQTTEVALPSHKQKPQVKATKRRQFHGERPHHELFGASDAEAPRRGGEYNGAEECEDDGDAENGENDVTESEEQQLRLGERFLRMMAVMTRLARMPLDDQDGDNLSPAASPQAQDHNQQPTALKKTVQKKEAIALQRLSPHKAVAVTGGIPTGGGRSHANGAAAPLLVPVNAATEPLRPHLTFEISMLLPQPMDTRQSSLQSPIQRKQLRPPQRRRKRRRRPRGEKRSWQTSHATWAPRASAAYIEEHSRLLSHPSKLMDKFAQLKKAAEPPSQMAKSSSMPTLNQSKYLYAFPPLNKPASAAKLGHEDSSGEDDDDEGCEDDAEESESDGHEDEGARSENNEPTFSSFLHLREEGDAASHTYPPDEAPPPILSIPTAVLDLSSSSSNLSKDDGMTASPPPPAAAATTTNVAMRKRPLFHQPAWISPELKTWLISSGMFPTKPRHAAVAILR